MLSQSTTIPSVNSRIFDCSNRCKYFKFTLQLEDSDKIMTIISKSLLRSLFKIHYKSGWTSENIPLIAKDVRKIYNAYSSTLWYRIRWNTSTLNCLNSLVLPLSAFTPLAKFSEKIHEGFVTVGAINKKIEQFRFKHIECLFVWILITRRCQKICKIYYTTGRLHMRLCLIIEALLERKIRTHLGRLHSSLKNPPSYKCMERHSDIWYNAMPICGKVNTRNQFVFALEGSCGIP